MKSILFFLLLFSSSLLCAETITVAKDGSGRYTTIGEAVNVAKSGDKIVVKKADYFESIRIDGKDNLIIEGDGAWLKVEDGYSEIVSISSSHQISITGLNGIHLAEGGCYNNVFGIKSSGMITLDHCIMNGSGIYGVDASDSDKLQFSNNTVTHCSYAGISLSNCRWTQIENNIFFENQASRGITVNASFDIVIKNNTIVKNKWIPIEVDKCERVEVINNIISFNALVDDGGGITYRGDVKQIRIDRNVLYENSDDHGNQIRYIGIEPANNLYTDPLFTNLSGGDFSLKRNSPCAGAGVNGETIGAVSTVKKTSEVSVGDRYSMGVTQLDHKDYANAIKTFKDLVSNFRMIRMGTLDSATAISA